MHGIHVLCTAAQHIFALAEFRMASPRLGGCPPWRRRRQWRPAPQCTCPSASARCTPAARCTPRTAAAAPPHRTGGPACSPPPLGSGATGILGGRGSPLEHVGRQERPQPPTTPKGRRVLAHFFLQSQRTVSRYVLICEENTLLEKMHAPGS